MSPKNDRRYVMTWAPISTPDNSKVSQEGQLKESCGMSYLYIYIYTVYSFFKYAYSLAVVYVPGGPFQCFRNPWEHLRDIEMRILISQTSLI